MRLTQFSDYALRLVLYLAQEPKRSATIAEVAEWYGISKDHLVKVAHALVQRGYVNSTQGRGGGLRLARPAAEIRLDALVRDTEPDVHIVECFDLERNTCRITAACGLKHILHDATSAFFAVLGKHSLADITTNPIRNHKRKS